MESLSLLAAWVVICGTKAELAQERGQRVSMWIWRALFVANIAFWVIGLLNRLTGASA